MTNTPVIMRLEASSIELEIYLLFADFLNQNERILADKCCVVLGGYTW